MLSRKTVLIIAGYVLLILLLINLTHQLHLARQEVLEAREMERKSEEYQVKLMNVSMYAPLAPDAIGGWDFSGESLPDCQRRQSGAGRNSGRRTQHTFRHADLCGRPGLAHG